MDVSNFTSRILFKQFYEKVNAKKSYFSVAD